MAYNWKQIYLDTFIPELPKLINDNFRETSRYFNVFYDPSRGVIIAPVNTTGNIRGAKVEGVTGVFDTLIVRKQFTNQYENTTNIDRDFYQTYVGPDVSTRDASTWEDSRFRYVDIVTPYIKLNNYDGIWDTSYGLRTTQLGQEVQLMFDSSSSVSFNILMDPSTDEGGISIMEIVAADSSAAWIKLIAVDWDASWGTSWAVKQYGGSYILNNI